MTALNCDLGPRLELNKRMGMVLEIVLGFSAGKKLELREGQSIRVGRTTRADFVIPHDDSMSSLHFSISVHAERCILQDLGSTNGTFLNGSRVQEAVLKNGDMILAGETRFSVSVPPETDLAAGKLRTVSNAASSTVPSFGPTQALQPSPSRTVRATKAELLQWITSRPDPLFALLDAARDSRVLDFLRACEDPYQSLYQGEKGEELATVAPYLVHLPKTSALLPKLMDVSWGQSWGVYLTCTQPFQEIRKHLRRFLTAKATNGRKLYFRFYDPRVLRVYIPTCTAEERSTFFGPVNSFLVEGDKSDELLVFPAAQG